LAGITYHGAATVEVRRRTSSSAATYESQSFRSARSPSRNFQRLSGSSSRDRKRAFCSSRSIHRKILMIVVPDDVRSSSNALIWS